MALAVNRPPVRQPARLPANGFALEWVAAGQNAKTDKRHREFDSGGSRAILTALLEKANLIVTTRRVQVVGAFIRSTAMPEASGIIPDRHGVRVRIRPSGSEQGFMCVILCEGKETPDQLTDTIKKAALESFGDASNEELPEPNEAGVVDTAVEIVRSLGDVQSRSLGEFAALVAEESGPGADPAYWMKALAAAEEAGRLYRNGTKFMLADTRTEPVPAQPEAVVVVSEPTPPPLLEIRPPAPLDDSAVQMLANNAGAMISSLSRLQKLNDERKNLLTKKSDIERQLELNTEQIRVAARDLDLTTLTLAADALR